MSNSRTVYTFKQLAKAIRLLRTEPEDSDKIVYCSVFDAGVHKDDELNASGPETPRVESVKVPFVSRRFNDRNGKSVFGWIYEGEIQVPGRDTWESPRGIAGLPDWFATLLEKESRLSVAIRCVQGSEENVVNVVAEIQVIDGKLPDAR